MFTIFFRTIILYLLIVLGIRLMGKRQVGELEPSELVLSFLIADLASVPMQDLGFPLHTGIIPILTLISVSTILSFVTLKSQYLRKILCGNPSIVIKNGEIDQTEMSRNRLTLDELLEELRCNGYTDLSTIQYAILESNGMISVLLYPEHQPVTAGQCKKGSELVMTKIGLPKVLICDGKIMEAGLRDCGHDGSWLEQKLKEKKCTSPSQVFLFSLNEDGSFYFAKKINKGAG